jgi:hypothetical protein
MMLRLLQFEAMISEKSSTMGPPEADALYQRYQEKTLPRLAQAGFFGIMVYVARGRLFAS